MDQKTYLEVTAMLNSFPQGSADPDVLIATFEKATANISNRAIGEAARRFTCGEVRGANPTFAPSVAEFLQECRRVPVGDVPSLPAPEPERHVTGSERARMRLKMPLYRHANECGLIDQLAAANKAGFRAMKALAERWGIPVPQELLDMPEAEAERQWTVARNQARSEIQRNPPPFMRRQRRFQQAAE